MLRRPLRPYLVRLRLYGVLLLFVFLSGMPKGWGQTISVDQQSSTCDRSDGSITVTYNSGIGPYDYYLNGVYQITLSIPTYTYYGLVGGQSYRVGVDDQATGTFLQSTDFILGVLAGPDISISTIIPATCLNNDGELVITALGGNGPFTYSIDNNNFVTNGDFQGLPSGSGITATVQDGNGCVSSISDITIPLNNDLTVSVDPIPPICEGTTIQIPAVSNGLQFSWTPTDNISDPTILTPSVNPTVTTLYTLTATRGICTDNTGQAQVVVNPAPIANAGDDVQTCFGKTVRLNGSGGTSYQWTPATGLLSPNAPFAVVIRPDSTITYALSVTDANGCTSLQSDSVTVFVTPPLKVLGGPDTIVSVGQPVQLYAIGPEDPGGSTYQWIPATGLSNPLIQDPVAVLNAPQEVDYIVRVTTSIGCTGTDTVVIKAMAVSDIIVPNAFSPNNDGHNDLLRPILPGIKTLKYFTIFDRWGRQVFTTSNAGVGWDGTLKGQVMETGVYVWMAMGMDIGGRVVERKGTVILVH